MNDLAFGFQAAPASELHKSDQALYHEVMEDCALGSKLGFDAAWLLEHHFSDYYPTPSPLLFMAHIAAAFPDLSLGTSVLVLPWYHPLRLAEEIAMLSGMTNGTLHLGIGRGTAKMEYDAYNVDMNEARARFAECYRIVEKGLSGEPFTHDGTFWKIKRPIRLRPEPSRKKVRFYGAIGSPGSAEVMGDLGVAPICLSTFPDKLLVKILERWRARAGAAAKDAILPISVKMFIADTDEEARARPALLPTLLRPAMHPLRVRRQSVGRYPGVPGFQPHVRQPAQAHRPRRARPVHGLQPGGQPGHHLPAYRPACGAGLQLLHGVVGHARHADRTAPAHDDALRRGSVPALLARHAAEAGGVVFASHALLDREPLARS